MSTWRHRLLTPLAAAVCMLAADAQTEPQLKTRPAYQENVYVLGPEDEVAITVEDLDELKDRRVRLDPGGSIDLPVVGRVTAVGLTVEQLQKEIESKLRNVLRRPVVSLNIVDYHSQPVSVLGAVNQPGVLRMRGPGRLLDLLSMAGGLRVDAGAAVRITREAAWGPIPVRRTKQGPQGTYFTAEIPLDALMHGEIPEENVPVRPHDTITVDRAEIVYVLGEVKKTGGFTLAAKENMSVLQALTLAEGLSPRAAAGRARLLRKNGDGALRTEIPVDLQKMLSAKAPDVSMRPDDILLVPNNLAKTITTRALESAIQIGTGIVIWRR